ncbi:MAG: TatD family hydrolase [Chloroflexi bacterium]|jgi:TatD DNase family protein|nr:TatD family hydrolase [Chloroflexota bacterium]
MQLFDSHCHLDSPRFAEDREGVIARAKAAGVTRMLTCGGDLPTSQEDWQLARAHPGVYAAVGVHPHEARSLLPADAPDAGDDDRAIALDRRALTELTELAAQPQVVAWGEIGLDYHYNFSPPAVQRAAFRRQLQLARELDLPVVIHSRESDEDVRRLVDEAAPDLRGVLHCFLSDQTMAEWALGRGLYLGIAGPITFKNVRHLADIARQVPPDRLLIETDAPYLAPHPRRGQRNEPAFVAHVAEKLADVLGLPVDVVAQRTTENACRLFRVS